MTEVRTEDLAALDAIGSLSDEEHAELRSRLATTPLAAAEAREIAEMAALIGVSIQPAAPPPQVKGAVLAAIASLRRQVVRSSEGNWSEVCAGVRLRKLASNRGRNSVTLLLAMDPGAAYPGHSHRGAEESYIVRGSCSFGGIELGEGDFFHVAAGESHGDVTTIAGCLLLIVSDYADYAAA